ncbi:hypothetical protein [Streptomyces sp. NPDC002763]|uniref:hypothetical protein n=1 Tax=Streptomyces sp. NPDC002763 TaxID=3154427 RepID=UPI0033344833
MTTPTAGTEMGTWNASAGMYTFSEYGKPAAALIPTSELEELQRLQVEADVAEPRAREAASSGPSMAHDEFMAQLEEEDRREVAS